MKVDISYDNTGVLTEYIESTFLDADAPMGAVMKMNIALDEIYSNIVKFSGASYAEITCRAEDQTLYLEFEDDGIPFDPLSTKEPDTSLSADERDVGGLGIFMVKKSMTSMNYEYKNSRNILSLSLKY